MTKEPAIKATSDNEIPIRKSSILHFLSINTTNNKRTDNTTKSKNLSSIYLITLY